MEEKKEIRNIVERIDVYDTFTGEVDNIAKNFLAIIYNCKAKYGAQGYYRIRFDVEQFDDSLAEILVYGTRLETDEEFNERIKEMREREEREKIRRQKQYEELKREFEGK